MSLQQKVTKNASEFDGGELFSSESSFDELAFGSVCYSKGLRLETPLRAISSFLKALYFSLHANSHLVLLASEK